MSLEEKAEDVKHELVEKKEEAQVEATEKKNELLKKLEEDGVVNPAGFTMAALGPVFIAAVPLTSFLAQRDGLLEKVVNAVCSGVAFVGTAGANHKVSNNSKVAALSALYIAATYAFSGASSAAGIFDLKGLPLRLYSAHNHLTETFPGFALAAALAQSMAPGDQTLINLLGLHVLSKLFVFYPAYVLNFSNVRSAAHLFATSAVINVAWKLSKRSNY